MKVLKKFCSHTCRVKMHKRTVIAHRMNITCTCTHCTCTQMSRLEAELKKEKEEKEILFRIKSASPDISSNHSSLVLSQELEIVKSKLEWEMEANVALEQKLNSLKQSLVVSGKGEGAQRSAAMADLQDKVRHLEQTLEHKEDEMKRQIQVQTRTIASLQAKLSEERQQRQELLQSAPTTSTSRTTTTESASADTTAMTKTLKEKEKEIQQLTQQLQQFEKTASNVAKITLHSKQQSSTIATLKQELQVQCTCTCTCIAHVQVYVYLILPLYLISISLVLSS